MAKQKATPQKTEPSLTKKKTAVKKTSTTKKVAVKKTTAKKTVAKKATAKSIVPKTKSTRKKSLSPDALTLLVNAVVEGIQEVKGQDITILDLRKIAARVCDYYIICNAESKTQVGAIADSIELMVKKQTNEKPYHTEGMQNADWVLVDYVNVVVHIFQTEARYFYNLESLWADAETTKIPN